MVALSGKIPMPSLLVKLETLAARGTVLFIHELGFHSSNFEGDSEVSINALRHKILLHSPISHLVEDTVSCKLIIEFLFLACFPARKCSSTCFNEESKTFSSCFNLNGVCSFRFP